jgi:predicted nuclease of predicted toxin-antitoxin system
MNFLIDAQLPRLLAIRLCELGHHASHTLDLASGNRTTDSTIAAMADKDRAVVISKDADFLDSHILTGQPARLLLVSTGNISNRRLLTLFEIHITRITACFSQACLVELTQNSLIVHD